MEHIHNPYAAPCAVDLADAESSSGPCPRRPLSATVFGWIGVFLGSANVLTLPFMFINRDDQMRIFAQMGFDPPLVHLLQVLIPGLFLSLLVIGIGLLRVRLWARRAFPCYAVASVMVLLLRAGYGGARLLDGFEPRDRDLQLAMLGQMLGDGLLVVFALVGLALFTRDRNRQAFLAYRAAHD